MGLVIRFAGTTELLEFNNCAQRHGVYKLGPSIVNCFVCVSDDDFWHFLSWQQQTSKKHCNCPPVEKGEVIIAQCLEMCAFCGNWEKVVIVKTFC